MTSTDLVQHFQKLFGNEPQIYRAPGRVNLIGEHTDYNDGFVMPAAIGFWTRVAIAPRKDEKLAISSRQFTEQFEFDLNHLPERGAGVWCDYILGVAVVLRQRGIALRGANLLVDGGVPIGAGLSSSAAVEVATALALLSLEKNELPMPEVAQLCRKAENEFVGARVGIMDQFVSCMGKAGHAFFLDCRSLEFKLVPIPTGIHLVVCNTMVKHDLATGSYNTRREECEQAVKLFAQWDRNVHALRDVPVDLFEQHAKDLPEVIRQRCEHVVREDKRVLDAAKFLTQGNLAEVGRLMRESHRSLRDLYQVSCRELDVMVESAEGLPGFHGGRMTGGGFGGCTVNLVDESQAEAFAKEIAVRYQRETGIEPRAYICSAEDGAGQVA